MRTVVWLFLLFSYQILNAQEQFWTHTGGPVGGTVYTLVMSSDGGKIFAQTYPGGIFFSTNRGSSWRNVVEWADSVQCFFLSRSGSLFAKKWNRGFYRSTDDGASWNQSAQLNAALLISSPRGIMFALTKPGEIWGDGVSKSLNQASIETNSIYRSADSGTSWVKVELSGLNPLAVTVNSQGILFVGSSSGAVARSTDNGDTWPSTSLLNGQVDGLFAGLSGIVYARVNKRFLYESNDSGFLWKLIGEWETSVRAFATDSVGNIFVGTDAGVYRRSGTGNSWELTSLQGVQIRSLLAGKEGLLFAGSAGHGVYRSTDAGTSWVSTINGLTATSIQSLLVTRDSRILAGTRESGLFSWQSGSTEWSQSLLEDTEVRSLLNLPTGNLLAAAQHGIYCSTDNGFSWQTTGLKDTAVFALALDSTGTILAGSYGIYLSKDHGVTWTQTLKRELFQILSITVNRPGNVFACIYGAIIWSKDSGATWKDGILVNGTVLSLASPSDGSVLAVVRLGSVARSTDNGTSWDVLPIYGATAIATGANNEVFAARGLQVFRSGDGGATWTQIADSPTDTYINAFALDREGYLYAGTAANGVYRSTQRVITYAEPIEPHLPYRFNLYQNYPNPFNPTTHITFSIPTDGIVSLKVFDVLGREIATLVNEYRVAGFHQVEFNAESLSSGVYLYRLESAGKVVVQKMMLVH